LIAISVLFNAAIVGTGEAAHLRLVLSLLLLLAIALILVGTAIALYTFYAYIKYRASYMQLTPGEQSSDI
jgi:hypothetical protein